MKNLKKAVISMSGGLDSTTLALYLLAHDFEVRAYAFNYGQKHAIEIKKATKNVKHLQKKGLPITLQIIDLRDAFNDSSSVLNASNNAKVPEGHYAAENMKSTVVENRNVIFSSIIYGKALAWANKTESDVVISLGIHGGDHFIYPDTTPESQQMARELFKISNLGSERVDYIAPFNGIDKGCVLHQGLEACEYLQLNWKTIYKNTISCYTPNKHGESCGKCGTCVERLEAFAYLGFDDPAKYIDTHTAE